MVSFLPRTLALGLAGAATLALGGCYDDGYGYGGVEVGAGYYGGGGGYGYGYGDPYYGGGYYGGYPSYGWFDGFYYPGNGYYVYDRGGRRYQMRDRDRDHWNGPRQGRAGGWQGRPGGAEGGGRRQWQGRPDGSGNGDNGAIAGQARDGAARRGWEQRRQAWQQRQGQAAQPGQSGQAFRAAPQGGRSYAPQPSRSDNGGGRMRGRTRGDQQ